GDSGFVTAFFVVTLSPPSSITTTVDYATAGGTATSGTDFVPASGTLTYLPGETTRIVPVRVLGDGVPAASETFTLNLSNASRANIADAQGVGQITDDDGSPSLSIGNVVVTEGDAGSTLAVFTVTLSASSGTPVTVGYATADGTARAGRDY